MAQPGTLDTSFNSGNSGLDVNGYVNTIEIQPDGKILVGGVFTTYNSSSFNNLVRLNADGTIDTSFSIGTGFDTDIYSIAVQSDGKVIVGGAFTTYSGTSVNKIVRLNSNGTIDNTFTIGTGFDFFVYTVAIQSDGKVLLGGDFTTYNGTTVGKIVRLNTNGTLDSTFVSGTGFDQDVYTIKTQSDGKIMVGGNMESYNGSPLTNQYLVRLNSNGSLDTSFSQGQTQGLNSTVTSIIIQPNGNILVGGPFDMYNTSNTGKVVRFNQDGTLDTSFNSITAFVSNSSVVSLALQPNGKILVGTSEINSPADPNMKYLSRINADGSLDATFIQGLGADGIPSGLAIQDTGKILVGGFITTYDVNSVNNLFRLQGDVLSVNTQNLIHFVIYPNPTKDILTINGVKEKAQYKIYTSIGQIIKQGIIENQISNIPLNCLTAGIYFIELSTEKGIKSIKFIKE